MYLKLRTQIELENKIVKQIILQKIRLILEEYRFDNVETINDSVYFNNNFFGSGSSLSYKTHVSKGSFGIMLKDNKTIILYKSYISLWGYTAILAFIIIIINIIIIITGFHVKDIFFTGSVILFFGLFMSYLTVKEGNLVLMNKLKEKIERNI